MYDCRELCRSLAMICRGESRGEAIICKFLATNRDVKKQGHCVELWCKSITWIIAELASGSMGGNDGDWGFCGYVLMVKTAEPSFAGGKSLSRGKALR